MNRRSNMYVTFKIIKYVPWQPLGPLVRYHRKHYAVSNDQPGSPNCGFKGQALNQG